MADAASGHRRVGQLAVVGATGAVGEVMLELLAERKFPADRVVALASRESAGAQVEFGNRSLTVQALDTFDFSDTQLALFSAGAAVSAEDAPRAATAGCVVVDNTSQFRRDASIPLVVPQVNGGDLANFGRRNIIANPNCSTIQMVMVLAPIHRAAGIKRIDVATYQSVSGAGRAGLEELSRQSADLLSFRKPRASVMPPRIAFNVIPQIDVMEDNGYTREEMKMIRETHRLLDDGIAVNPTCVRVPVFYGHSEAVHLELAGPLTAEEVWALLDEADGVEVLDDRASARFPTPALDAAGKNPVYVGRIRQDDSRANGLNLWIVADNLRKGAALNAVEIAECLVNSHL